MTEDKDDKNETKTQRKSRKRSSKDIRVTIDECDHTVGNIVKKVLKEQMEETLARMGVQSQTLIYHIKKITTKTVGPDIFVDVILIGVSTGDEHTMRVNL